MTDDETTGNFITRGLIIWALILGTIQLVFRSREPVSGAAEVVGVIVGAYLGWFLVMVLLKAVYIGLDKFFLYVSPWRGSD